MLLTGQLEMICLNVKSGEMDQIRVAEMETNYFTPAFFKKKKISRKSWNRNIQEIEFFRSDV